MDTIRRESLLQRWQIIQHNLLPDLRDEVGTLTPKLEKLIHILEWVCIEEFLSSSWCGVGRPPHERAWLANAFVAKSVLGLTTTVGLIERLAIDRALRRICGFEMNKKLPSDATFSRAFDEFARAKLAERGNRSPSSVLLTAAPRVENSPIETTTEGRNRNDHLKSKLWHPAQRGRVACVDGALWA